MESHSINGCFGWAPTMSPTLIVLFLALNQENSPASLKDRPDAVIPSEVMNWTWLIPQITVPHSHSIHGSLLLYHCDSLLDDRIGCTRYPSLPSAGTRRHQRLHPTAERPCAAAADAEVISPGFSSSGEIYPGTSFMRTGERVLQVMTADSYLSRLHCRV